jgi:hypothetical protein
MLLEACLQLCRVPIKILFVHLYKWNGFRTAQWIVMKFDNERGGVINIVKFWDLTMKITVFWDTYTRIYGITTHKIVPFLLKFVSISKFWL